MATSKQKQKRVFILLLLIACAVLITIYCQVFLETGTVFSHLFYIPIILSSVWWGRKGMIVAFLLGGVLIGSHHWFQPQGSIFAEILRGLIFVFVSGFVIWLGERILQERDTFSTLLEKNPFGIVLVDENDQHLYLNPEFTRITGYSIDDIPTRQDWFEKAYPDLHRRSKVVTNWQALRSGGKIDEELQIVRKDGDKRDLRFKAILLPDKRILMTLFDVSDQKQSESRIAHLLSVLSAIRNVNQLITREKDREALLRGVCEKLTETRGYDMAFIVLYSEGKAMSLFAEFGMKNRSAEIRAKFARGEMLPCTERAILTSALVVAERPACDCPGCPLSEKAESQGALIAPLIHDKRLYGVLSVSMPQALVTDPEEQALFKEVADDIALALNGIELEELRNRQQMELARYRDDLETMVEKRTEDLTTALRQMENEIVGRKKAEAQLIRADRLASLGQLSSGIAHEIRNPLAGIRLFLDILRDPEKFDQSEQEKEILSDLISNVERISAIIQRVLDFSKTSIGFKQKLDLNQLARETVAFWEAKIRKANITLKLNLSQTLPPVLVDPIQFQQVINNLILNAIEAMDTGGTLTVTTDYWHPLRKTTQGRLCLLVADTGCGIDGHNLESIFNPFFTTKPSGTGLGLAISHNIIEKHNGIMSVRSQIGEGSVFSVELPVCADDMTK
jgi:two-component system, cell cycle sensor histidine kinase and response regulator CckA